MCKYVLRVFSVVLFFSIVLQACNTTPSTVPISNQIPEIAGSNKELLNALPHESTSVVRLLSKAERNLYEQQYALAKQQFEQLTLSCVSTACKTHVQQQLAYIQKVAPSAGLTNKLTADIIRPSVEWWRNLSPAWQAALDGLYFTGQPDVLQLAEMHKHLLHFDASQTAIQSLQPVLALSNIKRIDCTATKLTDIKPLARLSRLQLFKGANTAIQSLAGLENASRLIELHVAFTPITNLQELRDCQNLQRLNINHTKVANLLPINKLYLLENIQLANTLVTDLSPLQKLTGLQIVNCAGTNVSDLSPLKNCNGLRQLNISGTKITSLQAVMKLPHIKALQCVNTPLSAQVLQTFQQAHPDCIITGP